MNAIDRFKEYFGMSPVAAYEDEYLDDYDRPVDHEPRIGHDHRDEYGYRDPRPAASVRDHLYEDPAPRARRHRREEMEPLDGYADERRAPRESSVLDEPRPRRYAVADAGPRPVRDVAPTRGAVALAPEDDFVDDGLVTTPETVVERPRGFGDGKAIGDHFRAGRAVVLDLSSMAHDDARRMVDFAAGLVFGLDGAMRKVPDRERTFLLQPAGMDLTEAEIREAVHGAFRG